jgi:hypothetical protein
MKLQRIQSCSGTLCDSTAEGKPGVLTRLARSLLFALLIGALGTVSAPAAPRFSDWSDAQPALDTDNSVAGGCPIESPNGLTLFMAINRAGGLGDLDIWMAHRADVDEPFGPAENAGAPINSPYADFCPTPLTGNYFLFVSSRPGAGTCGSGDIYASRNHPVHGWEEPVNLGCAELGEGPNTAGGEFSPSLVETDEGVFLYFSSTVTGNHDIYSIQLYRDGTFGTAVPVDALNTEFDDRMPNVSRNGLEIVFSSDRPTWGDGEPSWGAQDVYVSTRESTRSIWSEPVNLGPDINTGADETRASLSKDQTRLYFGRSGEIYTSHRSKIRGPK